MLSSLENINCNDSRARDRKPFLWIIASLVFSAVLVILLLRYIDFNHLLSLVKNVTASVLFIALALYIALNLIRAFRFRVLLEERSLPIKFLFPIAMYHNFLVKNLPFMTGEFSYILLIRRYLRQGVSKGVSSLFAARLYEMLLVVIGSLTGILIFGLDRFEHFPHLPPILISMILIILVLIYFSGRAAELAARVWKKVISIGPWQNFNLLEQIGNKLDEIPAKLIRLRSPSMFLKVFFLSVCTYGISMTFNFILLKSVVGIENFGLLLIIISLSMVGAWIPISVSGFGVVEGSWVVGLVFFGGLDTGTATAIGFFMHGCQVCANLISGLIGQLMLLILPAQKRSSNGSGITQA